MREMELLITVQNSGKLTNSQLDELKVYVLQQIDSKNLETMGNLKLVRINKILIGQCSSDLKSFQFAHQFKKLESIEYFSNLILKKLNNEIDDSFNSRVSMLADNKSLSPEEEIKKVLTHIKTSPDESLSLWERGVKAADVNEEGFSKKIYFDSLPLELKQDLQPKNGGTWFRANSSIHDFFNVIPLRISDSSTSAVIGYKIDGFSEKYKTINNYIPEKVRDYHKDKPCVISGKVHSIMELDHKIGFKDGQSKDDPRLKDPNYFQPMSKTLNDAKREHCKECKIKNCRFDARQLGYSLPVTKGSTKLGFTSDKKFSHTENPCDGCYLYDPPKFNKEHSKLMQEQGRLGIKNSVLEEALKSEPIESIFRNNE